MASSTVMPSVNTGFFRSPEGSGCTLGTGSSLRELRSSVSQLGSAASSRGAGSVGYSGSVVDAPHPQANTTNGTHFRNKLEVGPSAGNVNLSLVITGIIVRMYPGPSRKIQIPKRPTLAQSGVSCFGTRVCASCANHESRDTLRLG